MEYAIWEIGGREPVSVHTDRQTAETALTELVSDGIDSRNLEIRRHGGHAGEVFPGGIELHLPK